METPAAAPVASDPPPPRAAFACTVRGDGDLDDALVLHADRALSKPRVVIAAESGVQLALTELGKGDSVARARIGGQGLVRSEGYCRFTRDALRFRHDVSAMGGFATFSQGGGVDAVLQENGDRLEISIHTRLEQPAEVRHAVPCADLRWGWVSSGVRMEPREDGLIVTQWEEHALRHPRLTLHESPASSERLELVFRAGDDDKAVALERRGDWVRVSVHSGAQFRGWVHVDELVLPAKQMGAMTTAAGTHRTTRPRMRPVPTPVATLRSETPLYLAEGDAISRVGTAEAGVSVRPGAVRGEWVEIAFDSGYVVAPDRTTFLVAREAVSDSRNEDRNPMWRPPPLPVLDERVAP